MENYLKKRNMNPEERSIVENYINTIKEIIKKNRSDCGFDILDTSGSVFYTGYGTLLKPNGVYLIGINPGGIPDEVTVGEQLSELLKEKDRFYNAYQDEDWGKNDGLQIAIEDAFKNLHLCIRETCGSNLIFERTEKEESIENKQEKIKAYMYIHDYIINYILHPSVIIAFGKSPYEKLKDNWTDKSENEWDDRKNMGRGIPSPRYIESKEEDKILCYIPHSAHGNYKKFVNSPHAEEAMKEIRNKIHEKLDKRDKKNPPKWNFINSWQSLF